MKRCLHSRRSAAVVTRGLAFGVAWLLIQGNGALASFTEDFEGQTVGAAPSGWSIAGTNGTTSTANVASESGNQFLALRDLSAVDALSLGRLDVPIDSSRETAGYLQFDIRFNQGINSELKLIPYASKAGYCGYCLQPIELGWYHNFNNTNLPLIFRSRGNGGGAPPADPNGYGTISGSFPIGTWETIRVEFTSSGGLPRGTYSVIWNGTTNNYLYLNQGDLSINSSPLALGYIAFGFSPDVSTASIDLDNILFIPEPSALAMCAAGTMLALVRRRCSRVCHR
jgi:hypothetical protein